MFTGRTAAQILVTPQDERLAERVIETRLQWCFEQSVGPIVISDFGAQLEAFWGWIGQHLDRKQRVYGVLDYTQYKGPSEQKVMLPFQQLHPDPWKTQDLVVGTSRYKHQILHQKTHVFNAPIFGYEPPAGDYENVEAAFTAGASISWFGSWNVSQNASLQSNIIALMPGLTLATMLVNDIIEDHDFITQEQQAHQVYPRAPWVSYPEMKGTP